MNSEYNEAVSVTVYLVNIEYKLALLDFSKADKMLGRHIYIPVIGSN